MMSCFLLLSAMVLGAVPVSAASFTVNSTADASDSNIGDGLCDDGSGDCTLRAALQEANFAAGADTITITATGSTVPMTAYPALSTGDVAIIGPGSGNFSIDGAMIAGGAGLHITSDNNAISGITITGFLSENILMENADGNTFDDIVSDNNSSGTAGVEALWSNDNTFTNSTFSNSWIGIRFVNSSNNNTVENSNALNNAHSGMTSFSSTGNTFSGNTLDGNQNGMYVIQADTTTVSGNTISNSVDAGINIFESTSVNNVVQNNTISSGDVCVVIDQFAGDNTIENNGISDCGSGVIVGDVSGVVTITGNTISTSGVGVSLVRQSDAVQITNNTITGSTYDGIRMSPSVVGSIGYLIDGNTIDSNGGNGIDIQSNVTNLTITGNTITGSQGIGVSASGTDISDITIGGSVAGDGNTISGNSDGISMTDVDGLTIQGNQIGLDVTGVNEAANGWAGIHLVNTANVVVGGATADARNYIVSNEGNGIIVENETAAPISISGNYIGLNIAGDVTGITDVGISLNGDMSDTMIGGSSSGQGNVIVGSMTAGIVSMSSGATMFGNKIGTDASGAISAGYGNNVGIIIGTDAASNNQVGGTGSGEANIIAGNAVAGVVVVGYQSGFPQDNTISGNSIYGNDGNGIDHVEDFENPVMGHTANDSGDTDAGPNGFLNHPEITAINATTDTVTYDLDVPAGYYRLEFFKNPTLGLSASGYGEGEVFAGYSTVVTSSGSALTGQTHVISGGVSVTDVITATVTECADSTCSALLGTSEFSGSVTPTEDQQMMSGGTSRGKKPKTRI